MKLKIAQVIGLNTDQKAAQAISSARDGDNTFLAVLELTSDDAFTKGRQALSELEDFYFEFEGSPAEKLTASFKEAKEKFSGEGDFYLCLAAVSGKALYLMGKGAVEVYLKRANKLSPLLSPDKSAQLISGFLQESDRVLFSTKSLVTFLADELEKSLNLPIEIFEEEVGGKIGSSNMEDQGLAGLIIEAQGEDPEIPPLSDSEENGVNESADQLVDKKRIVFPKIFAKVPNMLKKLASYFPKSGRGRVIIAIILLLIIAGGSGYKYKLSRDQEKKAQFTKALQEAQDDFNGAKGLAMLNPLEAKNKLESAKNKINQALKLRPNNSDAINFQKQLEEQSQAILQESSVSDFPVFMDLDLIKKNFRATGMSLSDSKLLLLDPGVKNLVVVDLGKKSKQILAGSEQLGDAAAASLNGGLAFIYSKDKGVLKIDVTNSKLSIVAKTDKEWGGVADIYGFAGNIYLLDQTSNQIWKYLPTSGGYSDKREYLSKGTKVDFSSALRMQIESSVYVLKAGGEILRFTKGDKDNFSLGGLDKGVKDPKSFFVSSDTDNLYLLDSGNSRLLILTKTGSYKGQISGEKFAQAADLVVDEQGKKVYLLDGSKIYSVDLK